MPMLINTTAEFKEFIPASVTLDFKDIKPKIRLVEREIIKKIFSPAIYTRVTTESGSTAEDQELKLLLSEAVAHLALDRYMVFGQVQISSAGIQIVSTNEMKQAFEWQIKSLKAECSLQGWSAIESALQLLESLTAGELFDAWKVTPFYLSQAQSLITTLRQFEKYSSLGGSRVLFNKLLPVLTDQQTDVIAPALGSALWEKILSPPQDATAEKRNLLAQAKDRAAKALVFLTLGRGFEDTLMILSDNGPMVIEAMQSRNTDAVKAAPKEIVEAMARRYQSKGEATLGQLLEFCQTHSDVLTEYQSSPNFISAADQTDHIPRNDPKSGIIFL
jgi:hypothetical protein